MPKFTNTLSSTENITSEETYPLLITEKVSICTKLSYSLGHIFNDLAAAMWFSYTLIYLQRIAKLEPLSAGGLLLLGKNNIIIAIFYIK